MQIIGRYTIEATVPVMDHAMMVREQFSGHSSEVFVDGKDSTATVRITLFRHSADAADSVRKIIEALDSIGLVHG